MSISTFEQLGPILVSDLPPVRTVRLTLAARVRESVTRRLHERAFERALRTASPGEHGDLIALLRRS